MKIIFKDLINLLEKNPSIEEVSSKLFQLGHEHEIENDIFLMELTPNRGDCFSLLGLARDLSAFYGPIKDIPIYEKQIDVNGKTVQATKTTYDPQGNIVYVKDKLNGGTFP